MRGEGRFETHSRLVAVESATERAALFGASTSMAPPLIRSARCECESSATPPFMSISEVVMSEGVAVVRAMSVRQLWAKVQNILETALWPDRETSGPRF